MIFFSTTRDSHATLQLALDLVDMHAAAAASKWTVTKFSYSSFVVWLSNVSWKASNFFFTVILYLLLIFVLVSEYQ